MHMMGNCYVPGVFITMTDKSRESYDLVFDLLILAIRKIIPDWSPEQWIGMYWMTDFESQGRKLLSCSQVKSWVKELTWILIGSLFLGSQSEASLALCPNS